MSLILGIDTSSVELSIALAAERQLIATYSRYVRNSHAEQITQAVAFMLNAHGVGADRIKHIALAIGPGSFTGLRIGIAFVKGFTCNTALKVAGVSSLQSVACASLAEDGPLTVAFDARKGTIYWARFERSNGQTKRLSPDRLTDGDQFKQHIGPEDRIIIDILGYAKSTCFDFLAESPRVLRAETSGLQRGWGCIRASQHKNTPWLLPSAIEPCYLAMPNFTKMSKASLA
ncbi:MAG: tRNA (adenosine(37)-N6)-threonylcarbamoyltransferase complex dimerization subunit type 1 TsaB [Chitinivibrionales bacterium]|nr:tRNA (adenosine(37)-N6)-threonylcarbamoyltransferase complex dimerization subunit type 1 TsaB [Chitinivibrionales bacterium]